MKEYKSKITTMIFQSLLGLFATWFVYNLVGRLTHSFLFAAIAGIVVFVFFLYKVFYMDFITIILTDDKKLLVKRFGKIINALCLDNYIWSEYSKYSNKKDAEDQDIYYVNKETGQEASIDCTNLNSDDYEELLTILGAKNQSAQPVKVETIKR